MDSFLSCKIEFVEGELDDSKLKQWNILIQQFQTIIYWWLTKVEKRMTVDFEEKIYNRISGVDHYLLEYTRKTRSQVNRNPTTTFRWHNFSPRFQAKTNEGLNLLALFTPVPMICWSSGVSGWILTFSRISSHFDNQISSFSLKFQSQKL